MSQATRTITVDGERLPLAHLSPTVAILAEPAAKDYSARRAGTCEIYGLFSRLELKGIEPIMAGETIVRLLPYAGHNYFQDCLGEVWKRKDRDERIS